MNRKAEVLAIIPARGGSKGVPRKNLAPLGGKPLVAWTIDAARKAHSVDRVVVSTDDREIGIVSAASGAEVVRRPDEISGDGASSETAILHCIEHLQRTEGYRPDILVFLQCTSPLTLAEDIDGTVDSLLSGDADSALAVVDFHYFLWKGGGTDGLTGINHDKEERLLRQEREPCYLESGAVYVMKTEGFLKARHRFFGKTVHYLMPRERCWEIDEPVDLKVASLLHAEQNRGLILPRIPSPTECLVLDFDGVFTDNRVILSQDGSEAVACDRSDGLALSRFGETGIPILVLSSESNPVVKARCDKLGLTCLQTGKEKWDVLKDWLEERRIDAEHVVYVGNDVNDLVCLRSVGCGVAVADAVADVLPCADIVLSSRGGRGAIREVVSLIRERLSSANRLEGGASSSARRDRGRSATE